MLETIYLLTGEAERPVLSAMLGGVDPAVRVVAPASWREMPEGLDGARLLTFLWPEVVPAGVLGRLGYGAYNVHPGPPDYPGWAPAAFALYDGAGRFGATLHEMTARVDAGTICDVESFAVPPGCTRRELEESAFLAALRLLGRWAETLASPLRPPRLPLPWGGRRCTRRGLEDLARIPEGAPAAERERRERACGLA
jgi:methionyl-tRNA formyltransferase